MAAAHCRCLVRGGAVAGGGKAALLPRLAPRLADGASSPEDEDSRHYDERPWSEQSAMGTEGLLSPKVTVRNRGVPSRMRDTGD